MDANLTHQARPDAIDAERFGEMLRTPLFALLSGRMEAQLERARMACERANDEVELRRAQGAAQAWRVAVELPAAIHAELKKSAASVKVANRKS